MRELVAQVWVDPGEVLEGDESLLVRLHLLRDVVGDILRRANRAAQNADALVDHGRGARGLVVRARHARVDARVDDLEAWTGVSSVATKQSVSLRHLANFVRLRCLGAAQNRVVTNAQSDALELGLLHRCHAQRLLGRSQQVVVVHVDQGDGVAPDFLERLDRCQENL